MSQIKKIDELKSSAEAGDTEAQYHLGLAYKLGTGVRRDAGKARLIQSLRQEC